MQIDTLAAVSPPLPTALLDGIRRALSCVRRTEPDGRTSFEIFSGSLAGSFDHRISTRIVYDHLGRERLRLEGSVHKAISGHNVIMGPTCVLASVRWFVWRCSSLLGVDLPDGAVWKPHRVDLSVMYDLGSVGSVQEAIRALQSVRVARRSVRAYGSETACFPGGRFTAKVYAKGPEFRKHDQERLIRWLHASADCSQSVSGEQSAVHGGYEAKGRELTDLECILRLADLADSLLRVEVELKRRHWIESVGSEGCFSEIDQNEMVETFWAEVEKIGGKSMGEWERVRTAGAVWDRLHEVYSGERARSLYGTWMNLAAFGEDRTRVQLTRATFYRHRKELRTAGCDWIGADVVERKAGVPADFTLTRNSPYLIPAGEALEVREALRPFRKSA